MSSVKIISSNLFFVDSNETVRRYESPERLSDLIGDYFSEDSLLDYQSFLFRISRVHSRGYIDRVRDLCRGLISKRSRDHSSEDLHVDWFDSLYPELIDEVSDLDDQLESALIEDENPNNCGIPDDVFCEEEDDPDKSYTTLDTDEYGDTLLFPKTFEIACFAAGYAVEAAKIAAEGDACFAVVRPPGHHAERTEGKGFCVFNNMAIAMLYASEVLHKKVLCVDFDVHRGDGTQEIIGGDSRYHHFSVNEIGLYADEYSLGRNDSENVTNLYLPGGSGVECISEVLDALERVSDEFVPDLIGFSAGFDSFYGDIGAIPGPSLEMDESYYLAFRKFAEQKGIPWFGVLEGGYNPKSVSLGIKTMTD